MAQRIVGYIDYTTQQGDTFDSLALAAYSEEKLASTIIQANPDYCDVIIFDSGVRLRIPIIENIELPETLPPWRRSS